MRDPGTADRTSQSCNPPHLGQLQGHSGPQSSHGVLSTSRQWSGGTLPGGSFQKPSLPVTCLRHPQKPSCEGQREEERKTVCQTPQKHRAFILSSTRFRLLQSLHCNWTPLFLIISLPFLDFFLFSLLKLEIMETPAEVGAHGDTC